MRFFLFTIFLFISIVSFSQLNFLEGTWQGLKINLGEPNTKGKAIWFDFKINSETKNVIGNARIESPFTEDYALKVIKGKVISKNVIEFEDVMFGNKKNSGSKYWCLLKGKLIYAV